MSDTTKALPRRRRWIALCAALIAGVVAGVRVADIEPHVQADVRYLSGSGGQALWEVFLRARGGGEVSDLTVVAASDALSFSVPGGTVLKSGETKPLRVMVDGRDAGPLHLDVSYKNPDSRSLVVEIPAR